MIELTQSQKQEARTAIQKIARTYGLDIVEIINATIISVDKAARTCSVQPITGKSTTQIDDVGLMPEKNDGEFKIPSVGSTVGVAMSVQVDPYIISWSDLDEWLMVIGTTTIDMIGGSIKLGDGSYGGLAKTIVLQAQINKLNAQLQAVITALSSWPPVNGDGGAALKAFFTSQIAGKLPGDFSDIINEDITHGTT